MHRLPIACSLVLLFSGTVALSPVTPAAETTAMVSTLNKADADFVSSALLAGLAEVKTSELALKRGLTGTDRDFAKMIVDDHSAVNDELKSIAKTKMVAIPTALDEKQQAKLDELGKKNDADFPAAYFAYQVSAHKAAVSAFTETSDNAKDVDVKAFATKHLGALQTHLVQAKALAAKY